MDNKPGCTLCPHACNVVRKADMAQSSDTFGYCGMAQTPVVARAALHFCEEPCLSLSNGSGAVFFSGCTLRCCYCQNFSISQGRWGIEVSAQRLCEIFLSLQTQGAQNLNLISGTQFVPAIIEALQSARLDIPVVWNSSGYESESTLTQLKGLVQVYLPDYKYADNDLAMRLSGACDYAETALAAIRVMADQAGPVQLDEKGCIQRGVIVRHLILPGHMDNTVLAIRRLSDAFKRDEIWVSLMSQYTPCGQIEQLPELRRTLTTWEIKRAQQALHDAGWTNGYVQQRSAATTTQLPRFDGTGVRKT